MRLKGAIVFTVIEIITMVLWLKLAMDGKFALSVVVLSVGLFVEHIVSLNVGDKAKLFRFPPE